LGRPLPSLQLCRRLEPGELFLLSVTNPASFDSRYFGPVSASAVIGVAHPVWLETRP
ncbi:S26 family signal peptidase, partial [Pseudomonas aeruginosa]